MNENPFNHHLYALSKSDRGTVRIDHGDRLALTTKQARELAHALLYLVGDISLSELWERIEWKP